MAMRSNLLPKDCGFPIVICSKRIASTSQADDAIVGFSTISDLVGSKFLLCYRFGGNVCMLCTRTLHYPHLHAFTTTLITYYNHQSYHHTNKWIITHDDFIYMGLSENSVPLHTMVNDHYPH